MKLILFYILAISSCSVLLSPKNPIQKDKNFSVPNYSDLQFWGAHPEKKDLADLVPENSGFIDKQEFADANVFYIHPTTHLKKNPWNGDLNDEVLNKRTDEGTIKQQASVFNDCCKIYAPRYRQATIHVFLNDTKEGKEALDLAYKDVLLAFEYFQQNWNQDRAWILASHSQGTYHAARLLKEVISKSSKMRKTMVAAYTIGFPYSANDSNFPICKTPTQTGCLINWSTYLWDTKPSRLDTLYKSSFCVNPLSWASDTIHKPKDLNSGSMPISFDKIIPSMADAKCEDGILWTHKISEDGFPTLESGKNYHRVDFHLFYKQIRENASLRVKAFIENKKSTE